MHNILPVTPSHALLHEILTSLDNLHHQLSPTQVIEELVMIHRTMGILLGSPEGIDFATYLDNPIRCMKIAFDPTLKDEDFLIGGDEMNH